PRRDRKRQRDLASRGGRFGDRDADSDQTNGIAVAIVESETPVAPVVRRETERGRSHVPFCEDGSVENLPKAGAVLGGFEKEGFEETVTRDFEGRRGGERRGPAPVDRRPVP